MNSPSEKVPSSRSGVAAVLLFGLASAFSFPAVAAPDYYKFYKSGTSFYTGPYSGAGTVYDQTKLLAINCPIGFLGCGASDVFGNPLTFAGGAGTLTATATVGLPGSTSQRVWDDITPNYGGLGVDSYPNPGGSEDQIAETEVLKLSFANQVTLTGVATLFVSAHAGFGPGFSTVGAVANPLVVNTINFEISTDGNSWSDVTFANANNNALSITSSTFYFRQDVGCVGCDPTFYVGAIAVTPVPEPETYAMLLAGLGLLGFAARRRKLKEAAVA